ncbi:hypothetical protein CDAR_372591 [Caerostris darwini]|uniref:Uncharacterized protein n=1 Tax=Caerostris darwini TaxID=1538125 RepID=A0AAV4T6R4_9ARAC|nr:hypothetical protein CDAR_372591 [Caerostris darwini]
MGGIALFTEFLDGVMLDTPPSEKLGSSRDSNPSSAMTHWMRGFKSRSPSVATWLTKTNQPLSRDKYSESVLRASLVERGELGLMGGIVLLTALLDGVILDRPPKEKLVH